MQTVDVATGEVVAAFDYASLDSTTREVVQQDTIEIKSLTKRVAKDTVEIGAKLTNVKSKLGHGYFGAWLRFEFGWDERTARNFMRVAEVFKSENFSDLKIAPSALYLLAAPSTPDELREDFLQRVTDGEKVTYTDVRSAVNAAKYRAAERMETVLEDAPARVQVLVLGHEVSEPATVELVAQLYEQGRDSFFELEASGYLQVGDEEEAVHITDSVLQLQKSVDLKAKIHRQISIDISTEEKRQRAQSLPHGVYNVIYADPPWEYENAHVNGAANNHYPVMELPAICAFLKTIDLEIAEAAVLFMWATNPLLPEALQVLNAWDFTYKGNVAWVKTELERPGTGWYVRGRHELLLIATRGSFTPLDRHVSPPIGSVITAPLQEHSRKPDEAYEIIERLYPGCHCIELFARRQREGWDVYGNEVRV